ASKKRATSSGLKTTCSLRGSRSWGVARSPSDPQARAEDASRHSEEEPQLRHNRVLAGNRDTAGSQLQLIAPQIFRARPLRGPAEKNGEVPDGAGRGMGIGLTSRECPA